jgi:hypothetical protein
LALEGEGITWMGQPSRQGIALFSVRTEFWRSTALNKRNANILVRAVMGRRVRQLKREPGFKRRASSGKRTAVKVGNAR